LVSSTVTAPCLGDVDGLARRRDAADAEEGVDLVLLEQEAPRPCTLAPTTSSLCFIMRGQIELGLADVDAHAPSKS
jgi:hypothetical protein